VGFALSRGSGEVLAIFAALGIGLALPYLFVAALPRLATWLPRPGRWMLWLRRLLAALLGATAIWLLSVLAAQLPPSGVAVIAALLVAVTAVLAVRPRLPRPARLATPALVVLLAVAAVVAPGQFAPRAVEAPVAAAGGLRWQAWDPAEIPKLVAQGKRVFVDVTADWCITCQVNKRFVLDTAAVSERLGADGVVVMRADWTRPDEAIAQYLASFGRYGIPFNAVYGPGAPDGIALPELLSPSVVLDALGQASAVRAAGG
jgi:suppressor for copper-sensitivity B